jgi:UDP-glucose 4-epimerase
MIGKRIVVTGLGGLVGQHLQRLTQGHELWHVGRQPLPGVAHHVPVDLAQAWSDELLPPQADAVVHLAQSPRFRDFPEGADDVFGVNVATVARLLAYAQRRGVPKVILASTGGIYRPASTPLHEASPWLQGSELTHYPASKLASELLSLPYQKHLEVVVLRFFFIYGKEQGAGMLLPRLAHRILRAEPIDLVGPDGLAFNPIHASDAAQAVVASLALAGSLTINVAGPERITLREASLHLAEGLGCAPVFRHQEGTALPLVADIGLMTSCLGAPQVLPREGLVALGRHVRDHHG